MNQVYICNYICSHYPQLRRSALEFVASSESNDLTFDDRPRPEPNTSRHIRHTRSLSEPNQLALSRPEVARLTAVYEDEPATTTEEENLSPSTTQRDVRRRAPRLDHFNLREGDITSTTAAEENINLRERTLNLRVASSTPPSYRSVSGSIRRDY